MGIVDNGTLSFATTPTAFPLGSAPTVGDYDFFGVNSNTTVSTPTGFTRLDFAVNNQASYLFYREAVGGETDEVEFTTSGNHNTDVCWWRVRAVDSIDQNAKGVAFGSSSATSPTATTGALSSTGQLALAFVGVHNFATITPTGATFSNSFTSLGEDDEGSGATGAAIFYGYKENVGTAAVAVDATWTNGAFNRDTYVVTLVMGGVTVEPSSIASAEAFGTPFVKDASYILELQGELNRIAGTDGLGCAAAANTIAGTTDLDVVGALNTYVGNSKLNWKDLQGVANQMAGTDGRGTCYALSRVAPI